MTLELFKYDVRILFLTSTFLLVTLERLSYLPLQTERVAIFLTRTKRLLHLLPFIWKSVEAGEPEVIRDWTLKCQKVY